MQQAVARVRDPATEGREAVSWFRLDTPTDREAWLHLNEGDLAGAQQLWERAAIQGERSAEENLAVFYHILALESPQDTSVWVEALAWLCQAATGGNVHRQDVCTRVVNELTAMIRQSAADGDSRTLMQLLHIVAPYLEEGSRGALEQELFKRDLDRLRLDCANLRGQLLEAGESPERIAELEKSIGTLVVPQVERLIQTGLPGPAGTASREAALIYRSLGRTWSVQRERKERCLALESAHRYAPDELRSELARELESARLEANEQDHGRPEATPSISSEQLPPKGAVWQPQAVAQLPRGFSMLGTGLRLSRHGQHACYEAHYNLTILGLPIFPLRRFQVFEEFPGHPCRVETLPMSLNAKLLRIMVVFGLVAVLLVGVGQVTGGGARRGTDAERQAISQQIDELLEKVSDRAQRVHRLEVELDEAGEQENRLSEGPALALVRSRKSRLEADLGKLREEHEKLVDKLFRLEQKRQTLR